MKTNLWALGAALGFALVFCSCKSANQSSSAWKVSIRRGESARDKCDWITADAHFTRALSEAKSFKTNSPRLITTLDDLAAARTALRRYAEAEDFLQQRLQVGQAIGWTNTFEYMIALENLADNQAYQNKFEEAEQNYLRAESLMIRESSRMDPQFGLLQAKHGKLYIMQHRFDEAEECFRQAKGNIEFLERGFHPISYGRAYMIAQLGSVLNDYGLLKLERKDYPAAESLFRRSVTELGSQYGWKSLNLVKPLNNLAIAYARQGKFDQAEKTIERSLKIIKRSGFPVPFAAEESQKILSMVQQRKVSE